MNDFLIYYSIAAYIFMYGWLVNKWNNWNKAEKILGVVFLVTSPGSLVFLMGFKFANVE